MKPKLKIEFPFLKIFSLGIMLFLCSAGYSSGSKGAGILFQGNGLFLNSKCLYLIDFDHNDISFRFPNSNEKESLYKINDTTYCLYRDCIEGETRNFVFFNSKAQFLLNIRYPSYVVVNEKEPGYAYYPDSKGNYNRLNSKIGLPIERNKHNLDRRAHAQTLCKSVVYKTIKNNSLTSITIAELNDFFKFTGCSYLGIFDEELLPISIYQEQLNENQVVEN